MQPFLSGSNLSDVDTEAPDRKRKLTEDKAAEPKKVKLMQRASPSAPSAPGAASSSSAAAPATASASSSRGSNSKSLIDILMRGEKLDVGKGFRLFERD
jgi:hypothetical protein